MDSITRPEQLEAASNVTPISLETTPLAGSSPQTSAESFAGGIIPHETWLSRRSLRTRVIGFTLLGLFLAGGVMLAVIVQSSKLRQNASLLQSANTIPSQQVQLNGIGADKATAASDNELSVNGLLAVSSSIVIAPGNQPVKPSTGQIYYDRVTNHLRMYNGSDFFQLQTSLDGQGSVTNNNNTYNTNYYTNQLSGGGGVPAGLAFLAANQAFTGANTFRSAAASPGAFRVQNTVGADMIAVDTAANTIAVTTAPSASGPSGGVTVRTGDSSAAAAGNVDIDTGSSLITGTVVGTKDFESGLDGVIDWFNTSLATSSSQAHSGANSLAITFTNAFWGIIANQNLPGIPVVPGHQYYVTWWVRAATTPRTINANLVWNGSPVTTAMNPIIDSTSTWTQMSITMAAPAGATQLYFNLYGTAAAAETHYFDDMVVTDLSSSPAFSAIEIGKTNAKQVTIGNLNQIGATAIYGGSGLNLDSGAGTTAVNAGVLTLTGNAASSFMTTAGALTLTSAATATWGIAAATSGNGGNLTLRAGDGALGNNNGGDLVLQSGAAAGTGLGGNIILKPQTNGTTAVAIQDAGGTPLFTADTAGLQIIVSGTDSAFAWLTLTNAHIASTQTTPPTIGTPTACGTTPAAVITPGSTDSAGSFTVTAGSGSVTGPCSITLTFHQAYGAAPKSVIVTPTTAIGASPQGRAGIVTAVGAASFALAISPANPASGELNAFYYWVVE
ncbi:MAG TPA: carbohydrate binding domain-containing protein [Candidatus Saccharimonadia bacterium]